MLNQICIPNEVISAVGEQYRTQQRRLQLFILKSIVKNMDDINRLPKSFDVYCPVRDAFDIIKKVLNDIGIAHIQIFYNDAYTYHIQLAL